MADSHRWITRRGYILTFVLIILWPILSVPAGKFSRNYFAFWVLLAIAWGFGSAIIITVLPIAESQDELGTILSAMFPFLSSNEKKEKKLMADNDEGEAA